MNIERLHDLAVTAAGTGRVRIDVQRLGASWVVAAVAMDLDTGKYDEIVTSTTGTTPDEASERATQNLVKQIEAKIHKSRFDATRLEQILSEGR